MSSQKTPKRRGYIASRGRQDATRLCLFLDRQLFPFPASSYLIECSDWRLRNERQANAILARRLDGKLSNQPDVDKARQRFGGGEASLAGFFDRDTRCKSHQITSDSPRGNASTVRQGRFEAERPK